MVMPIPAGRPSERCGSGRDRRLAAVASGCAGAGTGRGAGTIGRSKVISVGAGTLRRRHHSSANTAASSAAAPAIPGQYQPGGAAGSISAGAAGVAGVTAKSVGNVEMLGPVRAGSPGCAVVTGAGCKVGPTAAPGVVRAGWAATGRGAVAAAVAGRAVVAEGVGAGWLALGLGAGVGVSRGAAVVTIGLSRSTGPCDPGGAGFTVAPGSRQSLVDCASNTAGASASPSATALAAAFKLPPDLLMLWSILRE